MPGRHQHARVMHRTKAIVQPSKRPDTEDDAKKRNTRPTAYFSFLGLAPLTFAVPRRVFWRFLRCLPICGGKENVSVPPCSSSYSEYKHTLLSAGLLDLGGKTNADESVVRLELLHGLGGVVNEGKAGSLAATELGAETEDGDLVLLGLVEAGELVAELILGDVGAVGVEDVPAKRQSAHTAFACFASSIIPAIQPSRPIPHPWFPSFNFNRVIWQLKLSHRRWSNSKREPGSDMGLNWIAGNSRAAGKTHTTICLRPSRGLRMNLRVRRVTGESESAMLTVRGGRLLQSFHDLGLRGMKWDFSFGGDFAERCSKGGARKIPAPIAQLGVSPNQCGLAF